MGTIDLGAKAAAENGDAEPPSRFIIQSVEDRLSIVEISEDVGIPVIDFAGNKEDVVKAVADACQKWGFFQVINHGVPESSIQAISQLAKDFFDLSPEEKEACNVLGEKLSGFCEDPSGVIKYGVSFNPLKEKTAEWRDYLRLHYFLAEELDEWPDNPSSFKNVVREYNKHITMFAEPLLGIISEGLGLESDFLSKSFGKHRQIFFMNYYPPYHRPELLKGVSAHSDPSGITILLQDSVGGLEVCHNGRWVPVKPIENAFVVNLADQMQILTNGKYKSAEHRARVNSDKARISIPVFLGPSLDTKVAPIPQLLSEQNPALYRESITKDYLAHFYSRGLSGKTNLDYVKI